MPGFLTQRRRRRKGARKRVIVASWRQGPSEKDRVSGDGDGVVVDIQPKVEDKVYVSAFVSDLSLTDQTGGSAHRHTPGRDPRSSKVGTLPTLIASHTAGHRTP